MKKFVLTIMLSLTVSLLISMNVVAATNGEIRSQMISVLYGGSGGYMSCDFDGYVSTSGRHEGIDFKIGAGNNVYSLSDGVVTSARQASGGLTTIAVYNSTYDITIIYLHTKNFSVSTGDTVYKGTKIAQEGSNGASSAHTHVELRMGYQTSASKSVGDYTLNNPNPYPYYEKILFLNDYKDIGTNFTANIIQRTDWATVINNNGNVEIGEGVGDINEYWWFVRQSDGSYIIESLSDNKYLDVSGADSANGTNIQTCAETGSDAQKWYIKQGEYGYILVPKHATSSCLDCTSGSTAIGTNMQLYTQNGTEAQGFSIYTHFDFKPANIGTNFYGVILNTMHWKPITCDDDKFVRIRKEVGKANQLWKFVRQSDGSYMIFSAKTGKALEMYKGERAPGNPVAAWDDDWGGNYQRWYIIPQGDGYVLLSKHFTDNNLVLDLYNNDSTDGTAITTYPRHNGDGQIWSIYDGDEVQLKAQTLTVVSGMSNTNSNFSWTSAYGENVYNLRIFNTDTNEEMSIWNLTETSAKVILPAGNYKAYVDASNYFEYRGSNDVYFTVKDATYNVNYNANGGNGVPSAQTKVYNKTLTLSTTKPTRTGYTFKGWNTRSDGTGTSYNPGGSYTENASTTLYAQWSVNSYYLDLNGYLDGKGNESIKGFGTADVYVNGVKVADDVSDYYSLHLYGVSYEIKDIKVMEGHTYKGVQSGALTGKIGLNNSVVLSFVTNTYNITYNTNGGVGNVPSATAYSYGTKAIITDIVPSRDGYEFLGWATRADASEEEHKANDEYVVCNDITFYAVWKAIPSISAELTAYSSYSLCNVVLNNIDSDCIIIFVKYKNGGLVSTEIRDYVGNEEMYPIFEDVDTVKVFVVDNKSHMMPLCKNKILEMD